MECYLIHHQTIDGALTKARQYRSLLEPELAISICLDIFAIESNNQEALIIYILALTDTFSKVGIKQSDQRILNSIAKLESPYYQAYYKGIFHERKARGLINHSMSKSFAYHLLLEAIGSYQVAKTLSPEDNDDAILRHNSCVRTIQNEHLEPRQDPDDAHWHTEA